MNDLDKWFKEHEEDLGVHKEEVTKAIDTIQNAMDMVGK